jgi:hypothetical protein
MTKNTTKPDELMTDEEMLAAIDRKLRSRRIKTAHLLKLQSKRELILKKMGRGRAPQATPQDPEDIDPDVRGMCSLLSKEAAAEMMAYKLSDNEQRVLATMAGQDRVGWELTYRLEALLRAERKALPKHGVRPAPGMTPAEVKSFYASGVQAAAPVQPSITIADVDS